MRTEILYPWEDVSDPDFPGSHLRASIEIDGVRLHVEAIEIKRDAAGRPQPCLGDPAADKVISLFIATYDLLGDGAIETMLCDGREYLLIVAPFSVS